MLAVSLVVPVFGHCPALEQWAVRGLGLCVEQQGPESISRRLRFDWNIINVTVESAFVALTRQQCGYAAGDASALRRLMLALRRDDRKYEFASIWFSAEDVIAAGKEEISRRDALERDKADRDKMDQAAVEQRDRQNRALEERLRRENGPRARALKDEVDGAVKADAMKPLSDKPRAATETQRQFPVFASWLNRRFDDQWETMEVSDIADFGKVQWNGRALDGVIVQAKITQRNRIKGAYETTCFAFAQVADDEFSMRKDMVGVQCGNSRPMLDDWKTRREFKSLWNADQISDIGTSR